MLQWCFIIPNADQFEKSKIVRIVIIFEIPSNVIRGHTEYHLLETLTSTDFKTPPMAFFQSSVPGIPFK